MSSGMTATLDRARGLVTGNRHFDRIKTATLSKRNVVIPIHTYTYIYQRADEALYKTTERQAACVEGRPTTQETASRVSFSQCRHQKARLIKNKPARQYTPEELYITIVNLWLGTLKKDIDSCREYVYCSSLRQSIISMGGNQIDSVTKKQVIRRRRLKSVVRPYDNEKLW